MTNRVKSFLWRTGMMVLAVVIDMALQNLASLNLRPEVVIILGLILGEVSKFINQTLSTTKVDQPVV